MFDELKQTIRDIEFLADPTSGELRIACPEAISAILPSVLERFSQKYPRVVLYLDQVATTTLELPGLRDRKYDLVLGQLIMPLPNDPVLDDLNVEILCDGQLTVAASPHSRWARRRKIDLADLVDEPWILATPDTWNYRLVSEAFRARGLNMPKTRLMIFSMHVRVVMATSGRFITTFPSAVVRFSVERFPLKVLPVNLPDRPFPLAIVTLKNRTLSPVVERFIEYLRDFTQQMRADKMARQ